MGAEVSQGNHHVEFRYENRLYHISIVLGMLVLVIQIIAFVRDKKTALGA